MDLEKVLSKLKTSPGYEENAKKIRDILDVSEERDSVALRKVADEIKRKRDAV